MKTKTCKNPVCNLPFEYKNSKQEFCCLHCKNQAAYIYQREVYEWEVKMQKARRKNIQILENLLERRITKVNHEELTKMGFNEESAHVPHKDEDDNLVFRYGNIGLRIISTSECELYNMKNNINNG